MSTAVEKTDPGRFPTRSSTISVWTNSLQETFSAATEITIPVIKNSAMVNILQSEWLSKYRGICLDLQSNLGHGLTEAIRYHNFIDFCVRYYLTLNGGAVPYEAAAFINEFILARDEGINTIRNELQGIEQRLTKLTEEDDLHSGDDETAPYVSKIDRKINELEAIYRVGGSPMANSQISALGMSVSHRLNLRETVRKLFDWWTPFTQSNCEKHILGPCSSFSSGITESEHEELRGLRVLVVQYIHGIHPSLIRYSEFFESNRKDIEEALNRADAPIYPLQSLKDRDPACWNVDMFNSFLDSPTLLNDTRILRLKHLSVFRRTASAGFTADIINVQRLSRPGCFAVKISVTSLSQLGKDVMDVSHMRSTNPQGTPPCRCTQIMASWDFSRVPIPGYGTETDGLTIVASYPAAMSANTTETSVTHEDGWTLEPSAHEYSVGSVYRKNTVTVKIPHSLTILRRSNKDKGDHGTGLNWTLEENSVLQRGITAFELLAVIKLHDPSVRDIVATLNIDAHFKTQGNWFSENMWCATGVSSFKGIQRRINLPLWAIKDAFQPSLPPPQPMELA